MLRPDEINKMTTILQYCSSDQHALIGALDHLIQTEKNEKRTDQLYEVKKALLFSWGENQKNNEMLVALPMLTRIAHQNAREITPGASLAKKTSFSGSGQYDFFLIENAIDHKRRILARKVSLRKEAIGQRMQMVPVCFGEYAAYLSEYAIDSEKEYITIYAMLENQWTALT